jgi:Effector-associated domain 1
VIGIKGWGPASPVFRDPPLARPFTEAGIVGGAILGATSMDGADLGRLRDAIRPAFTLSEFDILLREHLNISRQDLEADGPFPELIFKVLTKLEARRRLGEFIAAALRERRDDPVLQEFSRKHAAAADGGTDGGARDRLGESGAPPGERTPPDKDSDWSGWLIAIAAAALPLAIFLLVFYAIVRILTPSPTLQGFLVVGALLGATVGHLAAWRWYPCGRKGRRIWLAVVCGILWLAFAIVGWAALWLIDPDTRRAFDGAIRTVGSFLQDPLFFTPVNEVGAACAFWGWFCLVYALCMLHLLPYRPSPRSGPGGGPPAA